MASDNRSHSNPQKAPEHAVGTLLHVVPHAYGVGQSYSAPLHHGQCKLDDVPMNPPDKGCKRGVTSQPVLSCSQATEQRGDHARETIALSSSKVAATVAERSKVSDRDNGVSNINGAVDGMGKSANSKVQMKASKSAATRHHTRIAMPKGSTRAARAVTASKAAFDVFGSRI
jgi:hypothetical protein